VINFKPQKKQKKIILKSYPKVGKMYSFEFLFFLRTTNNNNLLLLLRLIIINEKSLNYRKIKDIDI